MLIQPLTSTLSAATVSLQRRIQPQTQRIAQNVTDVFQKAPVQYTPEILLKILNGDHLKITTAFLKSLPQDAYDFCVNYARSTETTFKQLFGTAQNAVFPEDIRDIIKYSDIFFRGLEKIAKKNNTGLENIRLVSIGQSPATIVKTLELKGIKTGYCPISGLRTIENPMQYLSKESIEKGFSHWKEFGFDLNSLFQEQCIIFVDHYETGITLDSFKQIMIKIQKMMTRSLLEKGVCKKDIKPAKLKFLSLADVCRACKMSRSDLIDTKNMEDNLFHTSYLKTLYSPLFKVPLDTICEIEKLKTNNTAANIRFNKLIVLLYDEMLHPQQAKGFKSLGMLTGQRNSRLSSVVESYFQ